MLELGNGGKLLMFLRTLVAVITRWRRRSLGLGRAARREQRSGVWDFLEQIEDAMRDRFHSSPLAQHPRGAADGRDYRRAKPSLPVLNFLFTSLALAGARPRCCDP